MRNTQRSFFKVMTAIILWTIAIIAVNLLHAGNQASAQESSLNPNDSELVYLPIVTVPPAQATVHLGVYLEPKADMIGELQKFESLVGKRHGIYHYYTYWGFGDFAQHRFLVDQIVRYGATPMLSFMSIPGPGQAGCNSREWNLDSINRGDHDEFLRVFAGQIAQYPSKFLFRWGHEMNLNDYSWSGYCNGANLAATQKFIAAYRRIVDIFRGAGASNVQWIWSPSYTHWPAETWNEAENYYPGDDYVDWIGVVGYNFGASSIYSGYRWNTFNDLFRAFLIDAQARHPSIPVMLADYASTEDDGGDKGEWITDAFAQMKQHPNLRAVVYFHYNAPEYTPPIYFKIDSTLDSLAAYQEAIKDSYFVPDPPD